MDFYLKTRWLRCHITTSLLAAIEKDRPAYDLLPSSSHKDIFLFPKVCRLPPRDSNTVIGEQPEHWYAG